MRESTGLPDTAENLDRSRAAFIGGLIPIMKHGANQFPDFARQVPSQAEIDEYASLMVDETDWEQLASFDSWIKGLRESSVADFEREAKFNVNLGVHFLIAEVLQSESPADALELLAAERRIYPLKARAGFAANYLNPVYPLWSLEELRDQTYRFAEFLTENRDAIIKTGVPAHRFSSSPLLHNTLGNLYPTKPEILAELYRNRPIKACGPMSRFSNCMMSQYHSLRGCCPDEYTGCSCVSINFINDLDAEAVERIEAGRPRLLEMKISILRCLAQYLEDEKWSPIGLWEACKTQLKETLLAPEGDFYLDMDNVYIGGSLTKDLRFFCPNYWRQLANYWGNPGGVTQILGTIMNYEVERTYGLEMETREALRELEGFPFKDARSYFDYAGKPGLAVLDNAIARNCEISSIVGVSFLGFRERLVKTIERELHVEILPGVREERWRAPALLEALTSVARYLQSVADGNQPPISPLLFPCPSKDSERPSGGADVDRAPRTTPALTIERWSEIAIGIHFTTKDGYQYYAFKPPPLSNGGVCLKSLKRATRLNLPEGQCRKVLLRFACSEDGRNVSKKELFKSLYPGGGTRSSTSHEHAAAEGLSPVKSDKLNQAMSEVSRTLREFVACKERMPFQGKNSPIYQAAFTVGFIDKGEDDNQLHFRPKS